MPSSARVGIFVGWARYAWRKRTETYGARESIGPGFCRAVPFRAAFFGVVNAQARFDGGDLEDSNVVMGWVRLASKMPPLRGGATTAGWERVGLYILREEYGILIGLCMI